MLEWFKRKKRQSTRNLWKSLKLVSKIRKWYKIFEKVRITKRG